MEKSTSKHAPDLTRIEFHRNAIALLPETNDSDPGVAILIRDDSKGSVQRLCTCKTASKKTCPHVLNLKKIFEKLPERFRENRFEKSFRESPWHHMGAVMADSIKVTPESIRMQDEIADTSGNIVVYNSLNHAALLTYLSDGDDRLRFKERCGDFSPKAVPRHRGKALKQLGLLTLSQTERLMAAKGSKTRRHAFEESFWYKAVYHGFREFGENGCRFEPVIEADSGEVVLRCTDRKQKPLLQFPVPRSKVRELLTGLSERTDDLHPAIHPVPLKLVVKVSFTPCFDLELRPLLKFVPENGEETLFDPEELRAFQYGNLFFLKSLNLFAKLESPEKPDWNNEIPKPSVVKESRVPGFLDSFKDELENNRYLVMDGIDKLQVFKQFEWSKILLDAMERDWCWLSMEYGYGSASVSLAEILRAKKEGQKYIPVPEGWIDCHTPGFDNLSFLSDLSREEMERTGKIKLSRMDLLRLRAVNDALPEISGDKALVSQVKNLFAFKPSKLLPEIQGMTSTLRNYQHLGIEWIWFLFENGFGGLLCDDMGLGKTHQTMAFMLHLKAQAENHGPFLVVCPTTVLDHWIAKIEAHAPGLKAALYHGGNRDLQETLQENDVVLTSYGVLRNDINSFETVPFCLAVFDEIQYIKNPDTLTYIAAKQLNARMKLGLTGTPIENTLADLKALVDLTVPGYLRSNGEFKSRYVNALEYDSGKTRQRELSRIISPFTLRRLKKTVLTELPEKIEDIKLCHLSEDQVTLYQDAVTNRGAAFLRTLKKESEPVPYIHIFALLTLLKQICDHPVLLHKQIDDVNKYQCGKWELFKELLDQSLDSGQKVVVYSQFLGMIEIISNHLNSLNVGFASLTGASRNRGQIISRFNNDPDCRVFVGSLKAGGTGIDLVAASVVIHYDRWWNAAREDQATDRVHRFGQKRGIQVFKLVTKGTLEEKISAIIEKKRNLLERVVKEDDPGLLKTFSREDLIEMLSLPDANHRMRKT